MAQQFHLMVLLVLMVFGSLCVVNGSHHKHIIIHVPYHVKHHHHTHTVYKHIKHIDHGHDHHIHHHDYKITIPASYDLEGGWSGDYGSIGELGGTSSSGGGGGGWDGGFDSGSNFESNNFGSLGWDDK